MSDVVRTLPTANQNSRSVATSISERLSEELVIALVGPVASGVSTAGQMIADILSQNFGYEVAPTIKMSTFIRAEMSRVGLAEPPRQPLGDYIKAMQTAGNELRQKFGLNYLAEKAVEKIVKFRVEKGGYKDEVVLPGRRAYVIDSLKNGEELLLLRQIYGETLCVVGVFAPDEVRKRRLENDGADATETQKILDRDQGEVATFGQKTRKIFVEADFFICNDQKKDELRQSVLRYFEIIFDSSIHTPTVAEAAMYAAEAAASNSSCMSRQVGASIVSKTAELISVGRNDVPKFRGGLYTENDRSVWSEQAQKLIDNDHRCFKWEKRICHNETRRNSILDKIVIQLLSSPRLSIQVVKTSQEKAGTKQELVRQVLEGTDVDLLTEFSRSIHAEMEAILAVAREGRHSLVGATLYTTTYPCHNCARHIVAAGITSVIYVTPYLKSLATALHGDAVTEDVTSTSKVVFRQYEGVAPRSFLRLFRPKADRKKGGKYFRENPKEAAPIFRVPLDGSVEYESKVIADLVSKEQTASA